MNFNFKKTLQTGITILFFIFILVYAGFKSKNLIFGVKIKNVNIENQTSTTINPLKITGNAKNAIYLSLNGREISIDKEGNFTEDIALSLGYNIISIEAKDKFGHEDIKNYKLIHSEIKE